jgi:quinol-cytochrome oxidoreductase complex cytochrome b subunit
MSGGKDRSGGWLQWLERRVNLSEIFSFITSFGAVYTPIDSQRPIREVIHDVAKQPVSVYAHWPRVLGLVIAILFALQAITGILLAFYYQATPESAFESTRIVVRDVTFGWLIHQVHSWGAYLLVAALVIRLLRLFWDGLYRAPRELMWMSALGLVWIAWMSDFTGQLLPWDNSSYWTVVRGIEVIQALPGIAPVFSFIIGGSHVEADMLTRFYVMHVLVFPILFVLFLYFTFATIRRVGLSPSPGADAGRSTSFRTHIYTAIILTVLAFGILVTLAVLLPFPFLSQADPYATPAGTTPPWYLLAPYAVLERGLGPAWIKGLLLIGIGLGVALFPLFLRGEATVRNLRRARLVGGIVFLVWIALTAVGALLEKA